MSQQWLRTCTLTVGGASFTGGSNTDLRIRFVIESATSQSPNKGEFTISNLSAETAKSLVASAKEKTPVELTAGYQGNSGTIFKGTVIQVRLGRESPTDTVVIINASEGDVPYNHGVVNKALAKGHTPKDQFSALVQAMPGLQEGYSPDFFKNLKYPRGVTMFGMARDFLRTLAHSHGCQWSIQRGKVDMVPINSALPGGAVVLNAQTGMIGLPVQTENSIEVKALINPQIQINGTIQLNNDSIQKAAIPINIKDQTGQVSAPLMPNLPKDGLYKVLHGKWEGDTRGQPWYVTMQCLALNGARGPLGQTELDFGAANAANGKDTPTGAQGSGSPILNTDG